MKIARFILFPLSILYDLLTTFRNKLYDWHIFQQISYKIPVIGIGNLSTGGTGKTPLSEYILNLLINNEYKAAWLSRGYGRKTSGLLDATLNNTSYEIGDEACQVKYKFPEIPVIVSESRINGINYILKNYIDTKVIILDDAFQHRQIKCGLNILLTDYSNPFTNEVLLPAGRLRESSRNKKRADIIVVTKTPNVYSPIEFRRLKGVIKPNAQQTFYFSYIKYSKLISYGVKPPKPKHPDVELSVLLFTGIANPDPLIDYVNRISKETNFIKFADHHFYTKKDLDLIIEKFDSILNKNKILLTTEKDIHRILKTELDENFKRLPLQYLKIETVFHNVSKITFDDQILNYLKKSLMNN